MNRLHYQYVLVGAGLSSSAAAVAIREIDRAGSMLLVGQEINRPYDRTPLSKGFLKHTVDHEALFTLPPDWFVKNQVQLRTGRRATRIDVSRHTVALDNGEEVAFDKLLIAVGGTPAVLPIPGAALPNVYYLRTLDDVGRLQNAIEKAKHEGRRHDAGRGRVVVIGAGWLGTELSATLTQIGLQVDLVCQGEYVLHQVVGEATGKFVNRFLSSHGVTLHLQSRALRLEGDGRVQRVVLTDGSILETDFVVPAVGMVVNKDILRGTTLAAEKAILTDAHACTSVPDIYAAGDCAAIFDPLFGKHRHLGHADHARLSGTLAGRNMAGAQAAYDTVSVSTTELFDLPIKVWGEARFVDRRLLRGSPKAEMPKFVEIGVNADGAVCQVVAVGRLDHEESLRQMVLSRKIVNGDEERLKDPSVEL